MKLLTTILFALLGGVSAQQDWIPPIFNQVSSFIVGPVNQVLDDNLSGLDPVTLGYNVEVPLGTYSIGDCDDAEADASFEIIDLLGFSTLKLDTFEMTVFDLGFPACYIGFDFKTTLDALNATYVGSVNSEGCSGTTTEPFSGLTTLNGVLFEFSFYADITFDIPLSLNNFDVNAFALTWTDLDVGFSDLGDLTPVVDELTVAIEESVTTAIETLVNATLLQDAFDDAVPILFPPP